MDYLKLSRTRAEWLSLGFDSLSVPVITGSFLQSVPSKDSSQTGGDFASWGLFAEQPVAQPFPELW